METLYYTAKYPDDFILLTISYLFLIDCWLYLSLITWRKIMKRRIVNALYAFLVLFLSLYLMTTLLSPNASMRVFHFKLFNVLSTSMEPTINKGDLIVVRSVDPDKLEIDDIITFTVYIPELGENGYVTHRIGDILYVDGVTIYKTHGDGVPSDVYDKWTDALGNSYDITSDDVLGKYVFRIPLLGSFLLLLEDPIFVLLLFINGVILYALVTQIKKAS